MVGRSRQTALAGLATSVLHVEAAPIPILGRETPPVQLSGEQYERLAALIEGGFHRNGLGTVIMVPGAHDKWARRALSIAGARIPA